jgi:hypothetical protein
LEQVEPDRERAIADEKDAVAYLAGILSERQKKKIMFEIENDIDFFAKQHMWLGMWIRNELRRAGFFYDAITMDGIWFPWLLKAVFLPENETVTRSTVKKKIWNYRIRSVLHHPLTKWVFSGFAYSLSLAMSLVLAHTHPAFFLSSLVLIVLPFVI